MCDGDALLKRRIACAYHRAWCHVCAAFRCRIEVLAVLPWQIFESQQQWEVLPSPCPQTRLFVKSSNIIGISMEIMGKNQAKWRIVQQAIDD